MCIVQLEAKLKFSYVSFILILFINLRNNKFMMYLHFDDLSSGSHQNILNSYNENLKVLRLLLQHK